MKNCCINTRGLCKKVKTGMNNCLSFANGLSIKNDSDINLKIKSKHKDEPLFKFRYACNKEFRLLPIIGVIVASMLVLAIVCDHSKKDCDCK